MRRNPYKDWLNAKFYETSSYRRPGELAFDRLVFGVEIELENAHHLADMMTRIRNPEWLVVGDSSLRDNGYEFVTANPGDFDRTVVSLNNMGENINSLNAGARPRSSIRTSVHVHMNVQHLPVVKLLNVMTAYWCIEPLLIEYFSPDRAGNLFCLRAIDAKNIPFTVLQRLRDNNLRFDDMVRYSALNVMSLFDRGTLEFRALHGTTDMQEVVRWVDALRSIYTVAVEEFDSPNDIIEFMSGSSVDALIDKLCPAYADHMKATSNYRKLVMEGVRATQIWCMPMNFRGILADEVNPPFRGADPEDDFTPYPEEEEEDMDPRDDGFIQTTARRAGQPYFIMDLNERTVRR